MKQHITEEQAKNDSQTFSKIMSKLGYSRPVYDVIIEHYRPSDVEKIDIGTMIEILGDDWQQIIFITRMHDLGSHKNLKYWKDDELCNALWEAIKAIL